MFWKKGGKVPVVPKHDHFFRVGDHGYSTQGLEQFLSTANGRIRKLEKELGSISDIAQGNAHRINCFHENVEFTYYYPGDREPMMRRCAACGLILEEYPTLAAGLEAESNHLQNLAADKMKESERLRNEQNR